MTDSLHTRRGMILSMAAALGLRAADAADARLPRIGYLSGLGYPELDAGFTDELRKQGLIEGRDLIIERRLARANSDDISMMGKELANSDLVLVVPTALPAALVVREANPRMPMVIGTCPGMVANGFAKSLERPGGIYTGVDELPPGVTARRLQLLKSAAPRITRVALLSTTPGNAAQELQLADAQRAAADLRIEVRPYRATRLDEIAYRPRMRSARIAWTDCRISRAGCRSPIVSSSSSSRQRIACRLSTRRGCSSRAGGLMAWAPDQSEQLRIAARMTARILAGTRPGRHPRRLSTQLST